MQVMEQPEFDPRQIRSVCGRYIYHLSIIDYLQKYDMQKKMERLYKVTIQTLKMEQRQMRN